MTRSRGLYHQWTPEEDTKLLAMKEAGATGDQIAAALGISRSQMYRRLYNIRNGAVSSADGNTGGFRRWLRAVVVWKRTPEGRARRDAVLDVLERAR